MQQAGAPQLREQDPPESSAQPNLRLVEPERRTITITGTPGHGSASRKRRSPAQEQIAARPDRVALWAFLLGLFLVLMAAATASAAV